MATENDVGAPEHDVAFEALVRDLEAPIGRFLAQITGDRGLAADLMQETFLVAWRERTNIPGDVEARRAWMYGVARNRALSALRRERRGVAALRRLKAQTPRDLGLTGDTDGLAVRDLLVRSLSPADRSLFVLRYAHGFDATELAALTGLKPDAVRKRLQRSGERLVAGLRQNPTATTGPATEEELRHVPIDNLA